MKSRFHNLLSVFGAAVLVIPFAGCETDAEEAGQVPVVTNAVVATPATGDSPTSATNTAANAGTNTTVASSEAGSTNVATTTNAVSGTNTVVSQQTTIVNRIPPALPAGLKLSKGVEEIVKLAQAGVSETVMMLYIEKSTESFDLEAAEIIYLNDIGIPSTVLAAMLNHDGEPEDVLHDALGESTNTTQVATAPPPPAQTVAPGATQPVEVSSNYVAAPQYGGTVVDPNAQQPVVVQQPAVVVQQPAVVVAQPAVTYSYFYSSLAPYGSWVEVPDYGWCWQPTIAVSHRGWRPYVHGGRWLHSDVGWYWSSDYSWGWAPFHYGRWYSAPHAGWVWVPDYTWGPSWVTWRRGRDYCGWAPLPPRCDVRPGIGFSYWGSDFGFSFGFGYSHDYYTFVPTRRFCDRRVIDHVVATDRSVNIYRDSTVVNNYIVGNNNTIVNNGIGRDYVANHTQNEIPRVRVADAATAGRPVQPDRIQRAAGENVVYRPNRPAPNLVAAHEAAVARTRNETARPQGDGSVTPGNLIPGRTERPNTVSPTLGAASAGRSSSSLSETIRPQITDRGGAAPVFGTPAPIRPEPDRSAEILQSRTSRANQEAAVRPSATRNPISRVDRSSSVIRPDASGRLDGSDRSDPSSRPGGTLAPRFTPSPSTGTVPSQTVRPGTGRGEIGRPGATTPSVPPTASPSTIAPSSPAGRGETARPAVTPSGRPLPATSPSFNRRGSEPARSPDLAAPQVSRPVPNVPSSGSTTRTFTRPAPNTAPTPVPMNRPSTTVAPSVSRPVPPAQGNINITPQPIQRSAPTYQAPAPAVRPNVIPRSETFSRQSSPVQSAPPPVVVRPQSITPVAPVQRSAPIQRSAPVVRPQSAPSVQRNAPSVNQAPINGGSFRSAPPAQASRPNVQPGGPSGSGRGRVEIGR